MNTNENPSSLIENKIIKPGITRASFYSRLVLYGLITFLVVIAVLAVISTQNGSGEYGYGIVIFLIAVILFILSILNSHRI
jgi:predicted membrane channel-forming protein YqfA (hemolysin III family)